jgi:hypothetical protein
MIDFLLSGACCVACSALLVGVGAYLGGKGEYKIKRGRDRYL